MRSLSIVVAAAVTLSSSAIAYDSIACGPPDVRNDCEGLEAARTPWFSSEHALIWKRTRALAGLPVGVDAPFTVETPTLGIAADDDWQSLLPAPLDLAATIEPRQLEIAVFAQLPDKSYALWDWTSGNEGCPPLGTDDITTCHEFAGHMGWLNSNHFLPQAEQAFQHHHTLALDRAAECAAMADRLGDVDGATDILEACDREALILEAIAQHYLQDAWSMGHMWQRWGSPNAADFADAVQSNPDLYSLKAVGDAVGRASGIIHGAKAITGVSDAMCSPDPGVAFSYGDELLDGAGDLFLDRVNGDETLSAQRQLLYGCAATAMREVYSAGAQAFGPLTASTTSRVDLVDCFPQRATNRAIALGSAIQVPLEVGGFEDPGEFFATTSEAFLANLGLTPELASQDSLYLPLTSTVLSEVDIFGARLIEAGIIERWNEEMSAIQRVLQVGARTDAFGTTLADGALGPLLSMSPNSAYPGVADYTDPPLPWTPTPLLVPAEPRVENAGNIMARTFVDAHAQDWCDVLHEDGDDEFSLSALRDRCINLTKQGDPAADVACGVCAKFVLWHLWPSTDGEHRAEDAPVCEQLAGPASATIRAQSSRELMDAHFSSGNAILLAGGSLDGLWCGFGEPMVAFLPPDVPEPLCTGSEQTTPVDIAIGRLTVAGDALQSLPSPQVIVTSSGRVYDTVVDGVRVLGVNVGPGTTRLHLALPEFGIERDFSVTVPERSCLGVCGRFFEEFGIGICSTDAQFDVDPACCCCL